MSYGRKLLVGLCAAAVQGVNQCDQNVYVQKERHNSSSINCRISSGVEIPAPGWIGSCGMPFRVSGAGRAGINPPSQRREHGTYGLLLGVGQILGCREDVVINGERCAHRLSSMNLTYLHQTSDAKQRKDHSSTDLLATSSCTLAIKSATVTEPWSPLARARKLTEWDSASLSPMIRM